jgi:glycosyltransferase involved in cell wall biosynthesis
MKITFVLPFAGLQGGIRVIAIYAERLARRGHDVFVVSDPEVFTPRRILKSLIRERRLPSVQPSYFDSLTVPHRVLEAERPVTDKDVPDADVVVASYFTTVPGVLSLSERKGAKAIFIQNYEVHPGRTNPKLDATWHAPLHKITISNWLVDLARTKFGDSFVSHIPNSVDTTQFHAPERGKQSRPTIGLLYNTSALKGMKTSLAAIRQVAEQLPSLRVLAFGAEPLDSHYPLPRGAEFHFRPKQQEIKDIYAQCDVWVCGSNVEGFHLPPLEAMACRCPVVSTKVGGPLDIVREGVNGHLVDTGDASALANRTLHVLNLPEQEWLQMSRNAYGTATHFTWEDATTMFEAALQLAIERRRRGDFRTPALSQM